LRESGDQPGAIQVMIASDDASYSRFGLPGRIWGAFLNTTIGYGYQPMRAIVWSFAVVIFGSLVVAIGKGAGVMRFKWPDRTPPPSGDPMVGLHPMLYSLDVFVPFVNLRQEQHWWPDETAFRRVHHLRPEDSGSRRRVALLPVAASHRGLAAQRDLHRRRHRLDSQRLIITLIRSIRF